MDSALQHKIALGLAGKSMMHEENALIREADAATKASEAAAKKNELETAKLQEEHRKTEAELASKLPEQAMKLAQGLFDLKRKNDLTDDQTLAAYNFGRQQNGASILTKKEYDQIMKPAEAAAAK
jgi:hypothetical protein